jgi:hypothetical protein
MREVMRFLTPWSNRAMTVHELYELLKVRPFTPSRVVLRDGRALDIPERDLCIVAGDYLRVGSPATECGLGVWASAEQVPVADVLRVEPLATSSV